MKILVKTYAGLEQVLAAEIKDLFGITPEILRRAVAFEGELPEVYKANYLLRTALRVLVPVKQFKVTDEQSLYRHIYNVPWEKYFTPSETIAVDSFAHTDVFNNSHFISLRTKDGIVDRFRDKFSERPSVDKVRPDIMINIHIAGTQATVSLDSSGNSLHLRGFRTPRHEAPLSEVLAAGLILLSGWDKKSPFFDPMCGSGTLLAEAAMMAHKIPPGFFRKQYAFENWKNFDAQIWTDIKLEYQPSYHAGIVISGADKDPQVIEDTREWIENTAFKNYIQVSNADLFSWENLPENTFIIMNPPYGERLREDKLREMYAEIGRWLKFKSGVRNAWIFSAYLEGMKLIGLKPSQKFNLFNGPLESKFAGYALYRGSKKTETA